MSGVQCQCKTCGDWLAPSRFERLPTGTYRKSCKACRSAYNAAAQAVCRARKASGVKAPCWDTRTPYTPAPMFDFGTLPERVALVASVGNAVVWPEYERAAA